MRTLVQPGPVHPRRIDWFRDDPHALRFPLRAGATLNEALTAPLVEAGFQAGTIVFGDVAVNPFRYVRPGPADGAAHVAYFSAPHAPEGISRIERANATFGWADGKPLVHCHAAWIEPDGAAPRRPHTARMKRSSPNAAEARAWGFATVRIAGASR